MLSKVMALEIEAGLVEVMEPGSVPDLPRGRARQPNGAAATSMELVPRNRGAALAVGFAVNIEIAKMAKAAETPTDIINEILMDSPEAIAFREQLATFGAFKDQKEVRETFRIALYEYDYARAQTAARLLRDAFDHTKQPPALYFQLAILILKRTEGGGDAKAVKNSLELISELLANISLQTGKVGLLIKNLVADNQQTQTDGFAHVFAIIMAYGNMMARGNVGLANRDTLAATWGDSASSSWTELVEDPARPQVRFKTDAADRVREAFPETDPRRNQLLALIRQTEEPATLKTNILFVGLMMKLFTQIITLTGSSNLTGLRKAVINGFGGQICREIDPTADERQATQPMVAIATYFDDTCQGFFSEMIELVNDMPESDSEMTENSKNIMAFACMQWPLKFYAILSRKYHAISKPEVKARLLYAMIFAFTSPSDERINNDRDLEFIIRETIALSANLRMQGTVNAILRELAVPLLDFLNSSRAPSYQTQEEQVLASLLMNWACDTTTTEADRDDRRLKVLPWLMATFREGNLTAAQTARFFRDFQTQQVLDEITAKVADAQSRKAIASPYILFVEWALENFDKLREDSGSTAPIIDLMRAGRSVVIPECRDKAVVYQVMGDPRMNTVKGLLVRLLMDTTPETPEDILLVQQMLEQNFADYEALLIERKKAIDELKKGEGAFAATEKKVATSQMANQEAREWLVKNQAQFDTLQARIKKLTGAVDAVHDKIIGALAARAVKEAKIQTQVEEAKARKKKAIEKALINGFQVPEGEFIPAPTKEDLEFRAQWKRRVDAMSEYAAAAQAGTASLFDSLGAAQQADDAPFRAPFTEVADNVRLLIQSPAIEQSRLIHIFGKLDTLGDYMSTTFIASRLKDNPVFSSQAGGAASYARACARDWGGQIAKLGEFREAAWALQHEVDWLQQMIMAGAIQVSYEANSPLNVMIGQLKATLPRSGEETLMAAKRDNLWTVDLNDARLVLLTTALSQLEPTDPLRRILDAEFWAVINQWLFKYQTWEPEDLNIRTWELLKTLKHYLSIPLPKGMDDPEDYYRQTNLKAAGLLAYKVFKSMKSVPHDRGVKIVELLHECLTSLNQNIEDGTIVVMDLEDPGNPTKPGAMVNIKFFIGQAIDKLEEIQRSMSTISRSTGSSHEKAHTRALSLSVTSRFRLLGSGQHQELYYPDPEPSPPSAGPQ